MTSEKVLDIFSYLGQFHLVEKKKNHLVVKWLPRSSVAVLSFLVRSENTLSITTHYSVARYVLGNLRKVGCMQSINTIEW